MAADSSAILGVELDSLKVPAIIDAALRLFRERGYKVTPQRQLIFRILHGSEVHPTAESVYSEAAAQMPTISLRTGRACACAIHAASRGWSSSRCW